MGIQYSEHFLYVRSVPETRADTKRISHGSCLNTLSSNTETMQYNNYRNKEKMLRGLRQKHRQSAKEFEKEKITFIWGTRRLMRSCVDKVALS